MATYFVFEVSLYQEKHNGQKVCCTLLSILFNDETTNPYEECMNRVPIIAMVIKKKALNI